MPFVSSKNVLAGRTASSYFTDSNTSLRKYLHDSPLSGLDMNPLNPMSLFVAWRDAAKETAPSSDPNACSLSTAALPSGKVTSRIVSLKALTDDGNFVFFTNVVTSKKAQDLTTNSYVAMVFHWEQDNRQVRVEGAVKDSSPEEVLAYFRLTSRRSRIASWASPQSQIIRKMDGEADDGGRLRLDRSATEIEERFADKDVPMPPSWGVLQVVPTSIEFWQSRENRLHDRILYTRDADAAGEGQIWTVSRLGP